MTQAFASQLPILLLAAGQSRRMRGRDKLMERIDGTPLILRQVTRARAATTGPVIVTLPPAPHPRYEALADLSVDKVAVPDAALGMSASLKRGLEAMPSDAPAAMVLLADLPELTTGDMMRVLAAVDLGSPTRIWRATTEAGTPGHPIVFSSDLFDALKALSGDTGGAEVIKSHRNSTEFVTLPADRALLDLDTPEDWAAWQERLTKYRGA